MGNKKCEDCGKEIDERYFVCAACNKLRQDRRAKDNREKAADPLSMIAMELKHMNWNLGAIRSVLENNTELWKKIKAAEAEEAAPPQ